MQGKKMNNPLNFIPDNYDDLFDWLSTFQCNFSAKNEKIHGNFDKIRKKCTIFMPFRIILAYS